MNAELLKSLNGAIDTAIQELIAIDQLSKSDVSLQDAKLRPETANGTLPGDNREESALKPEDAKKAEGADKGDLKIVHEDGDKANKGENPFADKDKDGKDDKSEAKEKDGKDKKKDDSDDEDMDDEKAEKLKAKIKKYEDDKAAKAALGATPALSKSETVDAEELKKSIVASVSEAMSKAFGDKIAQLEGTIQKLVTAPQPRQSVSGLAPLAKSADDVQPAGQAAAPQLTKAAVLDQLFTMQKSGDNRVDSSVIARVDMNDFSVLQERGINLK